MSLVARLGGIHVCPFAGFVWVTGGAGLGAEQTLFLLSHQCPKYIHEAEMPA
jgi:hypothetical protein